LILTSCSTSIEEYRSNKPELNLQKFFNGDLIAHGFFKNNSNKVIKTFIVKMHASWVGNVGTLEEDFVYSDGEKARRVWILSQVNEKTYHGKADDVIGFALGKIEGNALLWNYNLNLKVDKDFYNVHFEDWMYLIDENTLINQSYMTKFGINLGQVVLSIKKI
jgi:hypothetical protein